jgi:hypothetical protein
MSRVWAAKQLGSRSFRLASGWPAWKVVEDDGDGSSSLPPVKTVGNEVRHNITLTRVPVECV